LEEFATELFLCFLFCWCVSMYDLLSFVVNGILSSVARSTVIDA